MRSVRTLVLGGARSGKSAHAEGLVSADEQVTYVATGRRDPGDAAWQARIAAHVSRRPAHWRTVEAGDLPPVLAAATGTLLVDDIATWLTGALDDTGAWDGDLSGARARCEELVAAVRACPSKIVLVSAEVGLGVVPATPSGRLFRDELGSLNARLAEVCDEVLLLVAGVPLRLR
ncbi:adenosylcobinamide kinase/adenosylcobinamide-phosphate guanylyltransferase [Kutzneria viridogrisea]|uniref:Adenosylcobinamide kinase n=1 Tax=Kutzneria viridogrisea TaxID=47990 RepID=A0ABR6BK92_9PSEU|nr:adenosylcobinamide kinase/adenosylcobinamide-phosphate guanylyltransferase [Kutzneria viridogrisea]